MKKYIEILLLAASFFTLSANADVVLKDSSEILGKWNLYAEAAKLEGEKKAVTIEWDFQENGVLQTKATDTRGRTKEMNIAVKYSVADGVIKKQSSPGREKYESCKVVEKNGSNMTLKCAYLFYFLTKI
ncbi:MAG: hypothetical protein ACXWTK_04310 [Methylobacter sp.]